jgi:outer membrane protein TolC
MGHSAGKPGRHVLLLLGALGLGAAGAIAAAARAQEQLPRPLPQDAPPTAAQEFVAPPLAVRVAPDQNAVPVAAPPVAAGDRPLPINLPTALRLANVRPIDVAVAAQQIRLAAAQLEQARVLWLPTLYLGTDYFRHEGQIQDTAGNVTGNSHGAFLLGAGPSMVFEFSDAIFGPLAARQVLRARGAALQTARNDSLLAVAEAYFNVQQARGELAGAEDVARRSEDLVRRTRALLPAGVIPALEVVRARAQADRSRQTVQSSYENWRVASADLVRALRLDPSAVVQPLEPPQLRVTLVATDQPVASLVRIGLTNRPELATQQALVQAALVQVRQEKLRPLIPGIYLRGSSTPVTGTLGGGLFGGGPNSDLSNFGARMDLDLQVLWKVDNLGFGNESLVRQRQTHSQLARLELFRTMDRVAAEVAQAYAQAQSAAARLGDAEAEVRDAVESADKNLAGLRQTGTGAALATLVRPQEVVAAIMALAQAYADYYAAVADYDRAQFRLYHALGNPAQALAGHDPACPASGTTSH